MTSTARLRLERRPHFLERRRRGWSSVEPEIDSCGSMSHLHYELGAGHPRRLAFRHLLYAVTPPAAPPTPASKPGPKTRHSDGEVLEES